MSTFARNRSKTSAKPSAKPAPRKRAETPETRLREARRLLALAEEGCSWTAVASLSRQVAELSREVEAARAATPEPVLSPEEAYQALVEAVLGLPDVALDDLLQAVEQRRASPLRAVE